MGALRNALAKVLSPPSQGDDPICRLGELCRREGIAQSLYYK